MNKQLLKKKCCDRLRKHVASSCCVHKIIISGKKTQNWKKVLHFVQRIIAFDGTVVSKDRFKEIISKTISRHFSLTKSCQVATVLVFSEKLIFFQRCFLTCFISLMITTIAKKTCVLIQKLVSTTSKSLTRVYW